MEHFPMITMEELSTLLNQGYWVIKPCPNKKEEDYDNELEYVLRDKSIGIHFQINSALPINVTDEQIRQSSPLLINDSKKPSRKMVKQFIDGMNIGDKLIIGRGAKQSLFICDITSSHYFQDSETTEFKTRRRISNIRRIPEEFERKKLVSTLCYYQ